MSAADGRPAKIDFKGEVDVSAFNNLVVTMGRVESSMKKVAKAGEDAQKKMAPPIKQAEMFNAALQKGVSLFAAQLAGAEAIRRSVMAIAEAQERAAAKQLAAIDRIAQLSARAGSLQPGEDRARIEAFSRKTGFTATQSVDIFERGQAANPAMPWTANRNRSAALGEIADTLQVQDAAGFVEMGQRLMKGNSALTERGAAARALAMQQAGVTDVAGFAEQFGANTDVAVAAAQAAKDAGQDPQFVASLLGKVASMQKDGRSKAGREGAFAFSGQTAIDPVQLLASGAIPESFIMSEMTRGNKGASAKAFLAAMPGRLRGIGGLEGQLSASERAMMNDPGIMSKERVEASVAAGEWNEIGRNAIGFAENREALNAQAQKGAVTAAVMNAAPTALNAGDLAIQGTQLDRGIAELWRVKSELSRGFSSPQGPLQYFGPTGPGQAYAPPPQVRVSSPPGYTVEVKVRSAGERPSADAL